MDTASEDAAAFAGPWIINLSSSLYRTACEDPSGQRGVVWHGKTWRQACTPSAALCRSYKVTDRNPCCSGFHVCKHSGCCAADQEAVVVTSLSDRKERDCLVLPSSIGRCKEALKTRFQVSGVRGQPRLSMRKTSVQTCRLSDSETVAYGLPGLHWVPSWMHSS